MPKISVITICYNDVVGLKKTSDSVLQQTFSDFEYIIIDGGSTDGSQDLVKELASRCAFACSERDGGIYNAQNKGWQKAQGEYCLFLNAGDYFANDIVLEAFAEQHMQADIVYGDLLVDNGKDSFYRLGQPYPFTFDDLIYSTVFHPAAFIKRVLLEERGGYDESFKIVADYDFFVEMMLVKKCTTAYHPIPVAIFNTEGVGSDPANKKIHNEERRRAQLKYFSLEEIESAETRVKSRKHLSLRIQESVSDIPVVRELTNFGLLMYNRIRKSGK